MNSVLKKRLSLLVLILWMCFIFYMSGMNGVESKMISSSFVMTISKILNVNDSNLFITQYELLFRKIAHVSEYFILCLLLYNYLKYIVINNKIYLYVSMISFIYSISDEFHQSFISGRGCTYIDVLIDTIGICLALIVIVALKYYASKRKSN